MNPRIRELMAEAVTFRLDPDSNAHEAQVCPEDLELFAELIVQECADWMSCARNESGDRIGDSFYWSSKMKEHFGVES